MNRPFRRRGLKERGYEESIAEQRLETRSRYAQGSMNSADGPIDRENGQRTERVMLHLRKDEELMNSL
jgi:hypothetical protein